MQYFALKKYFGLLIGYEYRKWISRKKANFVWIIVYVFGNVSTNHDACTKKKSSSDLQAHCPCLSAPRVVGRTRCKLNCTNCPNGILKYIENWLWCSFSSCMRRWNSSFLSLLSRRRSVLKSFFVFFCQFVCLCRKFVAYPNIFVTQMRCKWFINEQERVPCISLPSIPSLCLQNFET